MGGRFIIIVLKMSERAEWAWLVEDDDIDE